MNDQGHNLVAARTLGDKKYLSVILRYKPSDIKRISENGLGLLSYPFAPLQMNTVESYSNDLFEKIEKLQDVLEPVHELVKAYREAIEKMDSEDWEKRVEGTELETVLDWCCELEDVVGREIEGKY